MPFPTESGVKESWGACACGTLSLKVCDVLERERTRDVDVAQNVSRECSVVVVEVGRREYTMLCLNHIRPPVVLLVDDAAAAVFQELPALVLKHS